MRRAGLSMRCNPDLTYVIEHITCCSFLRAVDTQIVVMIDLNPRPNVGALVCLVRQPFSQILIAFRLADI